MTDPGLILNAVSTALGRFEQVRDAEAVFSGRLSECRGSWG